MGKGSKKTFEEWVSDFREVQDNLKDFKYTPKIKFGGSKECYSNLGEYVD